MNKYLMIGVGVLVLALAGSGLYIRSLNSDLALAKANEDAANTAFEQCEKDKDKSYEVSNNYQKRLSDLNNQLVGIRMRKTNPICVFVDKPARGSDASAQGNVNVDVHGFSYEWGTGYGSECEKYRLQVLGLQEFIEKSR